jgi:hypothetical protein
MKKGKKRTAKKSKVRGKKRASKRKSTAKKLKAKRKVKSKRKKNRKKNHKKKALAPAPSRAPASTPSPRPMSEPSPRTTREWRTGVEATTSTAALTMRKAGVYPRVRVHWAAIYGCPVESVRHTQRFEEDYGWNYTQRTTLASEMNNRFSADGTPIVPRLEPGETAVCLTIGALSKRIEKRFPD